jgi:hypothetical protein
VLTLNPWHPCDLVLESPAGKVHQKLERLLLKEPGGCPRNRLLKVRKNHRVSK